MPQKYRNKAPSRLLSTLSHNISYVYQMIRKKKKEVSNQALTLNTAVETSSQFHKLKTKSP